MLTTETEVRLEPGPTLFADDANEDEDLVKEEEGEEEDEEGLDEEEEGSTEDEAM